MADFDYEKMQKGVTLLLEGLGEDLNREGLQDTPKRVVEAYRYWCSGYHTSVSDILKRTFTEKHDNMITLKNISVYSLCEHHLAPFFGCAHVSYIPDGKVLGLSKMARLVEAFARRLQLQERLTDQIAGALMEHLKPKGVGVVLKCKHLCMASRGIEKEDHETITSSVHGFYRDKPEVKSEFLRLTSS